MCSVYGSEWVHQFRKKKKRRNCILQNKQLYILACGGLALNRTLVVLHRYRMFTFILCLVWLMFGMLIQHFSTSLGCFFFQWHSLFNKGLDNIQWASFISDVHTNFRIISRRVPGFEISFPCGVWGRGWTTCLLFRHMFFINLSNK